MGKKNFRSAIVLLALLCVQSLAFAHAFDHPIAVAHADHACTSCAHGHSGNVPPAKVPAQTLLFSRPRMAAAPIHAGHARSQVGHHAARAPPRHFV
ncbi:hypothetical protein SSPSH_001777 [Salinisphaera shabanensis E1L3A]|uniref:Uncharacterized protein n=1 Tax=Salinisphaera shabanensis E1L3A TaxID=1033802 RepID=U2FT45_9GAMM|nr:hypothetical protein [Salinisphaera shabanensis]ERJ19169.1 hypothetical protein SSPSH_001777 [Salinisphaera shabanensis E1L3A]